jgi:Tfp pilus assembly protein PilF
MRSKLFFRMAFVGLLATATAAVSPAQGIGDRNRPQGLGNYRISGKVVMPDGTPARDVTVNVVGSEVASTTYRTNAEGEFDVPGLMNGNYTVSIRVPGFRPESESININGGGSGQSFPVVFYLKPSTSPNPLMKDVPKDAVAKYEKGMDKASKDDMKGAIADFDAAIAAYPNFAAAYYEKGAAQLKVVDLDDAIASFVKAIQLRPDYTEAKYGYGLAMFQKKDYTVSAAAFNDVIQQNKDMAEAHLNLGISLFYIKNVGAAETELKTALTAKGGEKLALAHLYLGQIYSQKKQNADAITELEKYLEQVPKAPNADRIKQAIEQLKKN